MRTIVIAQQKGGTGKTTTAHAIGAGLMKRGKKILFIDLDAQCNLSFIFKISGESGSSLDVLTQKMNPCKAIQKTDCGHIIPGEDGLANANEILTKTGKEYRLKEALDQIRNQYDFCIVDTPPALGILTINAFAAASSIIIPCQPDIFSLQATANIAETISTVRQYCNKSLEIEGFLITRYNSRQIIARDTEQAFQEAAKQLKTKVFKSKIRESVIFREAQASNKDIFSYAPKGKGTEDYNNVIKEILS